MFNSEFQAFYGTPEHHDFEQYPTALRKEMDIIKATIHPGINTGVFLSGFVKFQEVYNVTLAMVEKILFSKRYLTENNLMESDVCLFTTPIWFDSLPH